MTVVLSSLWMHIKQKKISSSYQECTNNSDLWQYPYLQRCMTEVRHLLQNILVHSMLILFALLINSDCNWICFYLSGTCYSQFCAHACGRLSWPGLRGRRVCFLLFLSYPNRLVGEGFASGAFSDCRTLTAGFFSKYFLFTFSSEIPLDACSAVL